MRYFWESIFGKLSGWTFLCFSKYVLPISHHFSTTFILHIYCSAKFHNKNKASYTFLLCLPKWLFCIFQWATKLLLYMGIWHGPFLWRSVLDYPVWLFFFFFHLYQLFSLGDNFFLETWSVLVLWLDLKEISRSYWIFFHSFVLIVRKNVLLNFIIAQFFYWLDSF